LWLSEKDERKRAAFGPGIILQQSLPQNFTACGQLVTVALVQCQNLLRYEPKKFNLMFAHLSLLGGSIKGRVKQISL